MENETIMFKKLVDDGSPFQIICNKCQGFTDIEYNKPDGVLRLKCRNCKASEAITNELIVGTTEHRLYVECYTVGTKLQKEGKPRPLIDPESRFETEAIQDGYDDMVNQQQRD